MIEAKCRAAADEVVNVVYFKSNMPCKLSPAALPYAMPFNLSWVDHDQEARDRVNQILRLLEEPGVRDELGLGQIRDAFSDLLFPGTNTIQTRLRYFLIVPWVYRDLEKEGISGEELRMRARSSELDIVEHLRNTADEGVIGRRAGRKLKRLPSSIYWLGLGAWGLRVQPGPGNGGSIWHRSLPAPPGGFPRLASLALEATEAEFLQDRVSHSLRGSLLAHLFRHCAQQTSCKFVWHHHDSASFPDVHKSTLLHARLFSETIFGALLLYNSLLARHAKRDKLIDAYQTKLRGWSNGLDRAALAEWPLDDFWATAASQGARINSAARSFVSRWVDEVRAGALDGESGMPAWQSAPAILVRRREKRLKGSRSRFRNPRLLDDWTGGAGDYRLNYRWETVRTYLADLARP